MINYVCEVKSRPEVTSCINLRIHLASSVRYRRGLCVCWPKHQKQKLLIWVTMSAKKSNIQQPCLNVDLERRLQQVRALPTGIGTSKFRWRCFNKKKCRNSPITQISFSWLVETWDFCNKYNQRNVFSILSIEMNSQMISSRMSMNSLQFNVQVTAALFTIKVLIRMKNYQHWMFPFLFVRIPMYSSLKYTSEPRLVEDMIRF